MLNAFQKDAQRWVIPSRIADPSEITLLKTLKLLWAYPPLQAMLLFRAGQWCRRKHIPAIPGMCQRLITLFYGLEITIGADIGGGLYIPHPVGMVIAPERIGEYCSIISSVTIGMRNEWKFPRIGSHVFIGAGARVLGDVEIGDGAQIGANAVVIHDIPAGATAVGIPAKVVRAASPQSEAGLEPEKEPEHAAVAA